MTNGIFVIIGCTGISLILFIYSICISLARGRKKEFRKRDNIYFGFVLTITAFSITGAAIIGLISIDGYRDKLNSQTSSQPLFMITGIYDNGYTVTNPNTFDSYNDKVIEIDESNCEVEKGDLIYEDNTIAACGDTLLEKLLENVNKNSLPTTQSSAVPIPVPNTVPSTTPLP